MPPAVAAPSSALFGHPHATPPGFDERSVYIFYLADDGAAPAKPGADAAAFSVAHLRPGLAPAGGAAGGLEFHPNVVVTREKTALSLGAFVGEQRKLLFERAPKFKVVREGASKVAGLAAHQTELAAALEKPRLDLVQWQVVTLRDGFAYCFFSTSTRARWEQDRPKFEAFVAGWK